MYRTVFICFSSGYVSSYSALHLCMYPMLKHKHFIEKKKKKKKKKTMSMTLHILSIKIHYVRVSNIKNKFSLITFFTAGACSPY